MLLPGRAAGSEQTRCATCLPAVWEPTVAATIVTPNDYVGAIMQLCQVGAMLGQQPCMVS